MNAEVQKLTPQQFATKLEEYSNKLSTKKDKDTDKKAIIGFIHEIHNRLIEVEETPEGRVQPTIYKQLPSIPVAGNNYLFERKMLCCAMSYFTVYSLEISKKILANIPLESDKTKLAAGILLYFVLEKLTEPLSRFLNVFFGSCFSMIKNLFTFLVNQIVKLSEKMAAIEWRLFMLILNKWVTGPILILGAAHYFKPELFTAQALSFVMKLIKDNQIDVWASKMAQSPYAPYGLYILTALLALGAIHALANKLVTSNDDKDEKSITTLDTSVLNEKETVK